MIRQAVLTFCGAAGDVTGSCYHLSVGDAAIVIDCGVFQGDREADAKNRAGFPFQAGKLVGVVLTHGHLDHVGRLPMLAAHLRAPVIGHAATLEIASIILDDSAKVSVQSDRTPLYSQDDVDAVKERMRPVSGYGAATQLGPFTVTLYDAGHILGSASVRVAWRDRDGERAILFSGDLGRYGTPLIRDPNGTWDATVDAIDWVVTESTYGDRLHPSREDTRIAFRDIVQHALDDGGRVLIPAFAIGRTQELLYELNDLVERGEIRGVPVIVDGPLGLSATRIYEHHRECYDADAMRRLRRGDEPLEFDHLFAARGGRDSQMAVEMSPPAIVIAGSGMCQGGRIRRHLREHLDDPRTDVLLVGYQARGTLGRALQEGRGRVWIDGADVPVRARVTTLSGFSAHADRDELLTWFSQLPLRRGATAFVTHGEVQSATAYAGRLAGRFDVTARVPALGDAVVLDV